jgi:ribosomal protein L37AE/L43A
VTNSGDFDSPFHDTEVMALEESIRDHPAKGFRVPRYTHACPACGRHVTFRMLEVPHYNPTGKAICSTCRKYGAKWFQTPEQRAARIAAKEAREAAGVKPHVPGGFIDS